MRLVRLGSALLVLLAGPVLVQVSAAAQDTGPPGRGGRSTQQMSQHANNGRSGGRMQQRFGQANTTHDGKLTLAQARAADMPAVARHFNEIDAGHKGYVTMDDVHQYRHRMMQQRRAAQGDGSAAPYPAAPAPDDPDTP